MSIKTKTTAAAALAALAVPAAALAHDKPDEDRGDRGRANAEERQQRNDDRRDRRGHRGHGRGFELKGIGVTGALPVADGALTGAITLDPTQANKGARRFLDLTRDELRGTDTVAVGEAGDEVVVRFRGLEEGDALLATDKVKIDGRLKRTATTGSRVVSGTKTLDVRRITVVRRAAPEQAGTDSQSDKG